MRTRPVLVIDNDAETVQLIADTLKPLGYPVISAASGDEGLNAAKTQSPILILINLGVPGTEGLTICKSFISIIDAPLILLTMREGKYDPRYKAQYGIVDFLKKPIHAHELAERVKQFAPGGTEEQVMPAMAEEAEELEMAEEAEAIEMVEEAAPSAAELAASAVAYAAGKGAFVAEEEELEEVEVLPDDELAGAVEVVEAIPAYDQEETEAEVVDEEEAGEWAIPEDDLSEAPSDEEAMSWEMTEEEPKAEAPAETAAPDWSMEEEEESPAGEDVFGEEAPPSRPYIKEEEPFALDDEEPFELPPEGGEDDAFGEDITPSRPYIKEEEPFALDDEEPYELPPEEREYEVRPAALERAKRRKSKSRILVPLLVLLLVGAAAAGAYFFFIAGEDMGAATDPKKPAPPVVKKAEPAPEPAKPVEKKPTAPERRPAPPAAPAEKKPTRVVKRPVAPKAAPPTTATTADTTYYVQFGAFRSKENATKFQSQLKELDYDTFVKQLTVSEKPLYLVLLSTPFTDKWTAFKQARQIKDKSDIGTAVHVE